MHPASKEVGRKMYCVTNYRMGDERDPRSPYYEEPPEGAFYHEEHAVDFIFETTTITTYEEALELIYYDMDNGLYWLEEVSG